MHLKKIAFLALVLCLGGCLTSPNPFFEQSDVIQDKNLVGSYFDHVEEVTWTVAPSAKEAGRYDLLLQDHAASIISLRPCSE